MRQHEAYHFIPSGPRMQKANYTTDQSLKIPSQKRIIWVNNFTKKQDKFHQTMKKEKSAFVKTITKAFLSKSQYIV